MRQVRRSPRVPAGCLLAALALALLSFLPGGLCRLPGAGSLLPGAGSLLPGAGRSAPTAPALHPLAAHAAALLRAADRVRADADGPVTAALERAAPAHVPYALLPTALALAAAVGLLARRGRRTDRSVRPARGVPTGRSPPVRLRAA